MPKQSTVPGGEHEDNMAMQVLNTPFLHTPQPFLSLKKKKSMFFNFPPGENDFNLMIKSKRKNKRRSCFHKRLKKRGKLEDTGAGPVIV